jgi:hypothetical protein
VDTYSFVAAGVYFSTICSRDIPLPELSLASLSERPPSTPNLILPLPVDTQGSVSNKYRRTFMVKALKARDECTVYDDYVTINRPVIKLE